MTRMGPLVFLFCSYLTWVLEAEGQPQPPSPPINVNNELELGTGIDDERDAMDVRTVMPSSWHRNPLAAVLRNTHCTLLRLILVFFSSCFLFLCDDIIHCILYYILFYYYNLTLRI